MRISDALPALALSIASTLLSACTAGEEAVPGPKPSGTMTREDPSLPPPPDKAPGKTGGDSSGSSGSSGSSTGTTIAGVPTEPAAMNAWLQAKEYATWAHESKPHASTGPHGGSVQTYINAELDMSLKTAGGEHVKGSAAVKEFYASGELSGWAVMVKTSDASDGGKGWYWYEVFDTAPQAPAAIEGHGNATCTGCHSRGDDFFRAPYPLQ